MALDAPRGYERGPVATTPAGTRSGDEGLLAEGREARKTLVLGYSGFGILSLIRALMFRGWLSFMLAITGIVLLVGQWMGPVGFIAFKLTTEDMEICEGDAGVWAKCVVASVGMIYFTRLSLAALAHKQERPQAFERYGMPQWWELYRQLDLVVTSLLYDTFIFLANLFIVFQDRSVSDMIVDVLALEFFTMIDDGFKAAVIEYDSKLLSDTMIPGKEATLIEAPGPQRFRERGEYSTRSSSWMTSIAVGSSLTTTLFSPGGGNPVDVGQEGGVSQPVGAAEASCDGPVEALCFPIEVALRVVRAICRVGGPLCAFVMIFYGPVCLGKSTST